MGGHGLQGVVTLELIPEFGTHGAMMMKLEEENAKFAENNAKLESEVNRLGGEVDRMGEENNKFAENNKNLSEQVNLYSRILTLYIFSRKDNIIFVDLLIP